MGLDALLASEALRRLVVHFVVHPEPRLHFRSLGRHLGLPRQSLRNALDRLEALGLVHPKREGQRVVYRATEHPGWRALRDAVRLFGDPAEVLSDLLADVPGIRAAFIFGSAANDTARPDSDVDLFIVGDELEASVLGGAVLEAGVALGREIDLKHYTTEQFQELRGRSGTSYLRRVLSGPQRWLIGSPRVLEAA